MKHLLDDDGFKNGMEKEVIEDKIVKYLNHSAKLIYMDLEEAQKIRVKKHVNLFISNCYKDNINIIHEDNTNLISAMTIAVAEQARQKML